MTVLRHFKLGAVPFRESWVELCSTPEGDHKFIVLNQLHATSDSEVPRHRFIPLAHWQARMLIEQLEKWITEGEL